MDIILSIILFFEGILAVIGFIFVYIFIKNVRIIKQSARGLEKIDAAFKEVKLVYIEQVNTMLMMHDRSTRSFVAQAPTEDELWAKAKALFPGKELILSENPDLTTTKK
jgi:hypothetical protein